MELAEALKGVRSMEDLPALAAALGCEPLWDPVPGPREPTVVVGSREDFPWYAVAGPRASQAAQALARRMVARGRLCGALGLDPGGRRLTVTVALSGAPRLVVDLDAPEAAALAKLRRLAGWRSGGAAGFAAHAVDVLGGESVGLRFFRQFRDTLERMAAGCRGHWRRPIGRAWPCCSSPASYSSISCTARTGNLQESVPLGSYCAKGCCVRTT